MLPRQGDKLETWKEIAAYLGRDLRTVMRWERERSLPVHRYPGGGRAAVFAYRSEIDEWLRSDQRPKLGPNESSSSRDGAGPSAGRSKPETAVDNEGSTHRKRWSDWIGAPLRVALLVLASLLLVALLGLYGTGSHIGKTIARFLSHTRVTRILDVSPIHADPLQTVVIRGEGFGPRPETILMDHNGGVDTFAGSERTSLVIADTGHDAHRWAAGRASEVNSCEISLRLESWTDSQIVLSGFAGPIGSSCGEKYQLAAGDHLEIAVFGPLNECGPGGVPNCPGEVGNGHIGVFRTEVLPSTEDHTCPEPALSSIRRQNASN